MYTDNEKEVLARCRRIETRLTVLMEHHGVPSTVRRPERNADGTIEVPTRGSSLQDVLALLESGDTTTVSCEGSRVCLVTKC